MPLRPPEVPMSLTHFLLPHVVALLLTPAAVFAPPSAAPDTVLTLSGRVIAADGGAPAGVRVLVRSAASETFAETDSVGRFSLPLPTDAQDDTVEVVVDAAGPDPRRYHPALLRLGRAATAQEQRIVLVPRRWTIPAGRFAGTVVEISPSRASTPACGGCSSFYPTTTASEGVLEHPLLTGWAEASFPLRLAFDRENSEQRITEADSAAFWRIARDVEADFGDVLFRPARYVETLPGEDGPNDVVLIWVVPSLRYAGMGTRGYRAGDVHFAAVWLQSTALLRGVHGPALLAHELIHTLGFGHTCSWRSVMAAATLCPAQRSESPTPEDVAYAQVARRVRSLQREHGARWGIGAARAGERATLLDPGPTRASPPRVRP